jgi:hypothetical protein
LRGQIRFVDVLWVAKRGNNGILKGLRLDGTSRIVRQLTPRSELKPADSTRRVFNVEGALHGSVRCEQLGNPHRAKEGFNGAGAVVSYLYKRGRLQDKPHETYDNRAHNCIRSSINVRICGRHFELQYFRRSPHHQRRHTSHRNHASGNLREYDER